MSADRTRDRDRTREDRSGDDRSREDRSRDERPRDERSRDERSRDDGAKEERSRGLRGLPPSSAVPKIIGTATSVIGLLDVVSAVFPAFRTGRMHHMAAVFPGTVSSLAAATSVVTGILLLMLAHGLKRGKQRAWWAAVALLPVGAATQLIYRHSLFGVLVSFGLMALLIKHRAQFTALSDPRTRWRAAVNFVALSAFAFGLGLVITSAHPAMESGNPGFLARCRHVLYGLFGFEGPVHYTSDRVGDVVGYSLGGLGLLIACSTVYLVLRPARPVAELSAEDEDRLRALLARHGARDSLGHFALRRDKSVVFSPSGKAAVCYRVVSGVALASGDPIGDVEAWPGAIDEFMALARAHAWLPAVVGCSETGGEVWTRETALDALELGDEAIVDTAAFTLQGRAMRNVRQMVKRIERAGYVCRVRRVRSSPRPRSSGYGWPRTPGAAPTPNAASRWRSAASARTRTGTAWWSPPTRSARRAPPTPNSATCGPSCTSCPGAPTACRSN